MKIYLDYVLIENFVMDFFILFQISKLILNKFNISKVIFLSVILSIVSVITKMSSFYIVVLNIIINGICAYILLKPFKLKELLKDIMIWYFVYFEMLGMVIAISTIGNISLSNILTRFLIYCIVGVVSYIINIYVKKFLKIVLKESNLEYYILINNMKFKFFLDTGNSIKYKDNKYYVGILNEKRYLKKVNRNKIIKQKYISNTAMEKIDIDIATINTNGNLKGYVFKNVKIENGIKKKNIDNLIIVFCNNRIKNGKYDGIIGLEMYLNELLEV